MLGETEYESVITMVDLGGTEALQEMHEEKMIRKEINY